MNAYHVILRVVTVIRHEWKFDFSEQLFLVNRCFLSTLNSSPGPEEGPVEEGELPEP